MEGSAHFFVGQGSDHAFNLPPVAEKQHIARVAAPFGASSRLKPGVVAKAFHELRSLGEGTAAGDVGRVHAPSLTANPFPDARRSWSTADSPCSESGFLAGLEPCFGLCHGRRMAKRTPMAGGVFLMAAILCGAVWGISIGSPTKGLLIGTAIGVGVAILVWLLDRSRAGR